MILFLVFAGFILLAATGLILWPIATHPTLPVHRKRLLAGAVFAIMILGGFGLYLLLGVPQIIPLLATI